VNACRSLAGPTIPLESIPGGGSGRAGRIDRVLVGFAVVFCCCVLLGCAGTGSVK